MNATLAKALVAPVPVCLLFSGSIVFFLRGKNAWSLLQIIGTGSLVVVVLTHVCEALQMLPWMHWGLPNSPGHYLDLSRLLVGVTLFPEGYLLYALAHRNK